MVWLKPDQPYRLCRPCSVQCGIPLHLLCWLFPTCLTFSASFCILLSFFLRICFFWRVHDNSLRPTRCATSRCRQLVARQLVAATTRCSDNSLRDISLRDNSLQRQLVAATNGCDDEPLQLSVPFSFWTISGHDAIVAFNRQSFNY